MAKDLAQRVRQTAAAHANGAGEAPTLRQLIERMKPEIGKALPKHMDPDRIARIAITLVGGNQQLAECTPESFLGALMTASQLGLEPGPLGEAYLVPYGNKVTFIPGYRGLIKLAYQSGRVKRIGAHIVRARDEFDFAYGLEPYLIHKPKLGDRGDPIAVYAAAALDDGEQPFVVMSIDEVERIRARSKAASKGPWVTDWDAMARKTAVRQLARWLPMSTELRPFDTAARLDNSVRTDVTGAVDEHMPDYITGEVVPDTQERPAVLEPAPANDEEPARPGQPEVESISSAQLRKLHTQLGKLQVADDAKHSTVSFLIGRPVESTKDLTKAEAGTLIDLLDRPLADPEPLKAFDGLLAALETAEQADKDGERS